jgi:hypothetical protein
VKAAFREGLVHLGQRVKCASDADSLLGLTSTQSDKTVGILVERRHPKPAMQLHLFRLEKRQTERMLGFRNSNSQ